MMVGCSNTTRSEKQTKELQNTPTTEITPYPQAEIPVPSFTPEELEAMGLPGDLSEESIASISYMYANGEMDMIISIPIYWEQVKPENAALNQCYFYLRADENNLTSFSISSQDGTIENRTEESAVKAYTQNEWKKYQDLQKELRGAELEIVEEEPVEIAEIGDCLGGRIEYQIKQQGESIPCEFLIWSTEDKIYCCTLIAKPEYSEYATESLDEILSAFQTM